MTTQYIGQANICENGSRGYEVHVKDLEGYEKTISDQGLTKQQAELFAKQFNCDHGGFTEGFASWVCDYCGYRWDHDSPPFTTP